MRSRDVTWVTVLALGTACAISSPRTALGQEPASSARVHIDSPQPVSLEVRTGRRDWEALCTSPCDMAAPLGAEVRATGNDLGTTRSIVLAAQPGQRVVLTVERAAEGATTGGWVLGVIGGVLVAGGATMIVDGAVTAKGDSMGAFLLMFGGVLAAGAGTGLALGGIVSVNHHSRPTLRQQLGPTQDQRASRLPEWRTLESPTPAPMTFPLVRGVF
jgi:hypothetical protein